MDVTELRVGGLRLTRVGYVDVPVPPELVGLDAAAVTALPWATPDWATEGQVRIGAAAWFLDADGLRLVFDPVQAADGVLRADRATEVAQQDAIAAHFSAAGFAPESVDRVVMSHIEGVGMVAHRDDDGAWRPFFPNARILISAAVLSTFLDTRGDREPGPDIELDAWQSLIDAGRVDTFDDGDLLAPDTTARIADGHCPGHAVFHCGAPEDPERITFLGHLAVSPLHLAAGPCAALNDDPDAAFARLSELAATGARLVGPLWPSPGHGVWTGTALVTSPT